MYHVYRLKTNTRITGLLPAIVSLVILGLSSAMFGMAVGIKLLGATILIYSAFQFIAAYRVRNLGYTISALYMLCLGLFAIFVRYNTYAREKFVLSQFTAFLIVLIVFFLLWLFYMLVTKRIKWRGREMMELAAKEIDAGDDTYTDRPRPIEKIEYTKNQLLDFADFVRRNQIAMPFFEQERVLFVPIKMGDEFPYLYGANINYWEKTWVAFNYDGNISAHISKEDYLDYKENLVFDALCASLGSLFIHFFELFRKGEQIRIIDELSEIKVGFFS